MSYPLFGKYVMSTCYLCTSYPHTYPHSRLLKMYAVPEARPLKTRHEVSDLGRAQDTPRLRCFVLGLSGCGAGGALARAG